MNALARHYDCLTAEERFRLVLAASGRGDEAERDRLVQSAPRIQLCVSHHFPYACAFEELALLVFAELLEHAALYSDACHFLDEAGGPESNGRAVTRATRQRLRDLADAAGYLLRVKAGGWKLFCERLNVPPFYLVEGLPGYERLEMFLAVVEADAPTSEGLRRLIEGRLPNGEPIPALPTPEGVADQTEGLFRKQVAYWSG